MDLQDRKNNIYFDKKGKQILVGDLLKVLHFSIRRRNHYVYHVVVMEQTPPFPVMALKSHYADKPHCKLYVLCDNPLRVHYGAEIIGSLDFQTKREKLKSILS